jgi:hypothetical protein
MAEIAQLQQFYGKQMATDQWRSSVSFEEAPNNQIKAVLQGSRLAKAEVRQLLLLH